MLTSTKSAFADMDKPLPLVPADQIAPLPVAKTSSLDDASRAHLWKLMHSWLIQADLPISPWANVLMQLLIQLSKISSTSNQQCLWIQWLNDDNPTQTTFLPGLYLGQPLSYILPELPWHHIQVSGTIRLHGVHISAAQKLIQVTALLVHVLYTLQLEAHVMRDHHIHLVATMETISSETPQHNKLEMDAKQRGFLGWLFGKRQKTKASDNLGWRFMAPPRRLSTVLNARRRSSVTLVADDDNRFSKLRKRLEQACVSSSPDCAFSLPSVLVRLEREQNGFYAIRTMMAGSQHDDIQLSKFNLKRRSSSMLSILNNRKLDTQEESIIPQSFTAYTILRLPVKDSKIGLDYLLLDTTSLDSFIKHQSIAFTFSCFPIGCPERPCLRPTIHDVQYFRPDTNNYGDRSLGETIRQWCAQARTTCNDWVKHQEASTTHHGCRQQMKDHVLRFAHGKGQICVYIQDGDTASNPTNDSIQIWLLCAMCEAFTRPIIMSPESSRYSFAKYLELMFYSKRFSAPSSMCQHTKSKTAIMKCFCYNGTTIKLVYEEGITYELRAPRIQAGPVDSQASNYSTRIGKNTLRRWRSEIVQDVEAFFRDANGHLDLLERYIYAETRRRSRENFSRNEPSIHHSHLDTTRKSLENDRVNLLRELNDSNEYSLNDFRRLFAAKSSMYLEQLHTFQKQWCAELTEQCVWDRPDYVQSKHIHCFPGSAVLVREEEPTSIIAYTLSSNDYLEEMKHEHQLSVHNHTEESSRLQSKATPSSPSMEMIASEHRPHILDGYYSSIERKYISPSTGNGTETASFRTMVIEIVKASVEEAQHHHAHRLSGLFKNRWHQNLAWHNETKEDNRKVQRQQSERLLEIPAILNKDNSVTDPHLTKEVKISSFYCDTVGENAASPHSATQRISPHIKHSTPMSNYQKFVHDQTEFTCTVYYAREFEAIRRQCGIDQLVIQSLSRCHMWTACGGKSKSHFYKTRDDRFVVKEMVNAWNIAEKDAFLKFAPKYFDYLRQTVEKPTILAKIFGFYTIKMKSTVGKSVDLEMDVMVMEHLFYGQTIARRFDLKGIQDRHVDECRKQQIDATLWDGDWLDEYQMNLCVDKQSRSFIDEAIQNDTQFLSQCNIMDYSLLVGVDNVQKEMVVGIVDFIGTYTWYKKMENKGKTTFLQVKKEVTVVPPDQYRERFCREIDNYFIAVPGKFDRVQPQHQTSNDS
ncbi:hypothetical protein EC973_007201 [Apophysomyces ossiformis]|uniref:PIPK domain-containing protein n=1 Tax=Apophysomyces ossiformis TaxID=679940 RepID=A0A8H7ER58_9FUNG|nr:hypothetical protein EC973_007201 [Apophysomyces ossiformis]